MCCFNQSLCNEQELKPGFQTFFTNRFEAAADFTVPTRVERSTGEICTRVPRPGLFEVHHGPWSQEGRCAEGSRKKAGGLTFDLTMTVIQLIDCWTEKASLACFRKWREQGPEFRVVGDCRLLPEMWPGPARSYIGTCSASANRLGEIGLRVPGALSNSRSFPGYLQRDHPNLFLDQSYQVGIIGQLTT